MRNIGVVFCITLIIIYSSGCKSKIVEPPEIEVKPGSRNYVWDSFYLPVPDREMIYVSRIWGTNINNLWIIGYSSLSLYGIWHYDGNSWTWGSNKPTFAQSAIWGSASNNIWLGNIGGILWRYDGKNWDNYAQLGMSGYNVFVVQNLWGVTEKEVYLIGVGMNQDNSEKVGLYKYNGNNWQMIDIPEIKKNGNKIVKDKNGDLLFYCSEYSIARLTLYSWNGRELKQLCDSRLGYLDICRAGDKTIIILDHKIYEYNNGEMMLINDFSSTYNISRIIYGRNEKDIFVGLFMNGLYKIGHYNGTDIQEMYSLEPNNFVWEGFAFEKDIFVNSWDVNQQKSKIIHGQLIE